MIRKRSTKSAKFLISKTKYALIIAPEHCSFIHTFTLGFPGLESHSHQKLALWWTRSSGDKRTGIALTLFLVLAEKKIENKRIENIHIEINFLEEAEVYLNADTDSSIRKCSWELGFKTMLGWKQVCWKCLPTLPTLVFFF